MRCQSKPLFEPGLPKRPVPTDAPVLIHEGSFGGKEYRGGCSIVATAHGAGRREHDGI